VSDPNLQLIEADLVQGSGAASERFRCGADFDRELHTRAVEACAGLLENHLPNADSYRWCVADGAFASGVEAWLQLEVLQSLRFARPSLKQHGPFVVRILDDIPTDTTLLDGSNCQLVLVSSQVIDAHAALLRAVLLMCELAERPYEGAEPWCRSDLVGGPRIEALAREQLGLAYGSVLKMLRWEGAYALVDELRVPLDLPFECESSSSSSTAELSCGAPLGLSDRLVLTDRLVWGPVRFLVLRESAARRVLEDHKSHEAGGTFERTSAGDAVGVLDLLRVLDNAPVPDRERGRMLGAVSVGVALQMTRVRRVRNGTAEAVRRLCLHDGHDIPRQVHRLGRIETQMRCVLAGRHLMPPEGDWSTGFVPWFVFDEMQVVFGLAAALTITSVGGRVTLDNMCHVGWDEVGERVRQEVELSDRPE
jgi:hypothetical protein